ncbi:MAG TPA: hypothetical protein VHW65_09545 [Gemmatimonadales bacterium]|jgi:hypothetical protein|nr:hypothetical protein [Gemmatimonadales bacterium]
MRRHLLVSSALLTLVVVAPALAQQNADSIELSQLPVGRGTVPLSNIQMQFRSNNLQIAFTPLNESVLRLLAPDSYRSLHGLLVSQQGKIDSIAHTNGIQDPGVAMVSLSALTANTRFDPELLTVSVHLQPDRPVGWIALGADFANQVLDARQQVTAIFVFAQRLPVNESFTVTYLDGASDDWQGRIQRLDQERARLMGLAHRPGGN